MRVLAAIVGIFLLLPGLCSLLFTRAMLDGTPTYFGVVPLVWAPGIVLGALGVWMLVAIIMSSTPLTTASAHMGLPTKSVRSAADRWLQVILIGLVVSVATFVLTFMRVIVINSGRQVFLLGAVGLVFLIVAVAMFTRSLGQPLNGQDDKSGDADDG